MLPEEGDCEKGDFDSTSYTFIFDAFFAFFMYRKKTRIDTSH